MVVQNHVVHQRLLYKAMGLEDISDPAAEAFNHAVDSGCPGPLQAMLDTQLLAQQVQLMAATRLFLPTGDQAICELLAVTCQQPGYLGRTCFVQGPQEYLGARCLGRLDLRNTQRVALPMVTNK